MNKKKAILKKYTGKGGVKDVLNSAAQGFKNVYRNDQDREKAKFGLPGGETDVISKIGSGIKGAAVGIPGGLYKGIKNELKPKTPVNTNATTTSATTTPQVIKKPIRKIPVMPVRDLAPKAPKFRFLKARVKQASR